MGKPLYKSHCYQTPERASLVEGMNNIDGEDELFDYRTLKDPSKKLSFVGVDAMEYDEMWPSTQYVCLSQEVCSFLHHAMPCQSFVGV